MTDSNGNGHPSSMVDLLSGEGGVCDTLVLIRRSIQEDWPVENRENIIRKAEQLAVNHDDPRVMVAAQKVCIAADAANIRRRGLVLQAARMQHEIEQPATPEQHNHLHLHGESVVQVMMPENGRDESLPVSNEGENGDGDSD